MPVGSFEPNAWGLFDMHGNVWEWCEDLWHRSYEGAPMDGSARADASAEHRVIRGGSWFHTAGGAPSANRFRDTPGSRNDYQGFRPRQAVTP